MYLVYIWHNDRYKSKVYISNILPWPIGQKGEILEKPCVHFRRHSLNAIFKNFARMFISVKSTPGPKLGHVGSKSMS